MTELPQADLDEIRKIRDSGKDLYRAYDRLTSHSGFPDIPGAMAITFVREQGCNRSWHALRNSDVHPYRERSSWKHFLLGLEYNGRAYTISVK